MKTFQIPRLSIHGAAMSLLGLCLLSGLNTPAARADFTFGQPTNLGPTVNSAASEYSHCVSYDGLELYFGSNRAGGSGGLDLWVSTRPTAEDDWGSPRNLGSLVNSLYTDLSPCLSAGGLELYFHSNYRPGGLGEGDIWVTKRAAKDLPWGKPENLGPPVNSAGWDYNPCLSSDGLELYFAVDAPYPKLVMTRRATTDDPWEAPVNLGPVVNSWPCQDTPWISSGGLVLLFTDYYACSPRPGGFGGTDVWFTRRATKDADWDVPVNVGPPVNTAFAEDFSMISPNGSMLYFNSTRPGGSGEYDLWQAPIIPLVDLNGDGKVDGKDILCMASRWSTDDPACDIGPTPFGDGIVNAQDLIVLSEYLFKDVNDLTLVAHWALDETQGDAAHESVNGSNDVVAGNPLWQPTGGQVNGAIQLDGVDDCVVTSFIPDPAEGPFSVLAWVKGGAPSQAVISELMGVNWLMADAEGKLMTELTSPNRDGRLLQSGTVITDGQWHRLGLVWDGSRRMLYVDGVVAAEGTQSALSGSGNCLYIGTGKNMEPGSFWSGLIDDVRIYNRAVRP